MGIGSGSYRDGDTDQMIEVKQFETFHVFGPQVSESDSRLQEDKLFTYLRRGTHRVDFTGAQVLTPVEAGK